MSKATDLYSFHKDTMSNLAKSLDNNHMYIECYIPQSHHSTNRMDK